MWGSGVLEVRKSGVFREVLGGQEAWKSGGLNSRIVTIIFETENLFFSAREGYSTILLGNPGRPRLCAWLGAVCSAGGLRVVWGLLGFSDSRSRPAQSQPARGCGSAEGYVRRAVAVALSGFRFPVRPVLALSPAVQGLLAASLCPGNRLPAAATSRLKRFSPVPAGVLPAAQPPPPTPSPLCRPCPQVPAGLHAPASCSAAGPAGSPGPRGGLSRRCGISAAVEGAGLPPAEGLCFPGHGPAADAHALGTARMAWMAWMARSSPAPMTASLAA